MRATAPLAPSPRGNRAFVRIAMMTAAAVTLVAPFKCAGQDEPPDYRRYTFGFGGGAAPVAGTDANNLLLGPFFRVGGGFAATPRPVQKFEHGKLVDPGRRWSLYITGNFMFDRSAMKSAAVQEAVFANPQNTQLLTATSGDAKFYATTLDLTFRFQGSKSVGFYMLGGFGWLRRSLAFNGIPIQGQLLEPTNPSLFGPSGNSGALDAGVGEEFLLSRCAGGLRAYVEARVLHGLAINSGTTLIPLSVGIRW